MIFTLDQRQLDLWQPELDALPWGGRSPRVLTKAYSRFIFQTRVSEDDRFFADPDQLLFSLEDVETTAPYTGAVPLLPLPWRIK